MTKPGCGSKPSGGSGDTLQRHSFYEVITLIAAVAASTTRSIANQFEIVLLIFIRDVFKDFASAKGIDWLQSHPRAGSPLAFDMWSGLLMFLLATVFQQLAQRQVRMPTTPELISGVRTVCPPKECGIGRPYVPATGSGNISSGPILCGRLAVVACRQPGAA